MSTVPFDEVPTHEDNAQAIRLELQRLVQGVRGLTLLTTERRRKICVTGHVDDEFLRSMALLIEAHPHVAAVSQVTAAEIRDHLTFTGSYQDVGAELALHGRKVDDTLFAERAAIGERVMRALKIARDLNTPAGVSSLVPHLEAIEREFSRGRRRRNKPQTDETKPPTDPATPEVKP